MKTTFVAIVSSLLVVALVLPLSAQEAKPAQKGEKKPAAQKNPGGNQLLNAQLKKLEGAALSEEQTAKIKELVATYAPKINEARQKQGLSKEQAAAQKEARAKAQADGLKGKALQEAVTKALNLTEVQTTARAELQKVTAELNAAVVALLSPEQKEKAGVKGAGAKKAGGAKKPAGEKKPAEKKPAETKSPAKAAAKDAAK